LSKITPTNRPTLYLYDSAYSPPSTRWASGVGVSLAVNSL